MVSAKVKLLWFSNLPGGSWQVSLLSRLWKVGWSGCVVACFKQASGACTLEVLRLVCSGLKLARGFLQVNLLVSEVLWVWLVGLVGLAALWSALNRPCVLVPLMSVLRLVCSGLKLARGFLQVNLFFWVAWSGCGWLLFEVTFNTKRM